uniref:Nose resistant-to-fluoxetine protein N-terminal domain-containing protein n=1 Tax=Glossina austeni TaxID=7395 RepID=A0A1A9UHY8_GLOAU
MSCETFSFIILIPLVTLYFRSFNGKMFLHSRSGVLLVSALIVIAGSALSDQIPASPFSNELGYQYFVSASKFPSEILSSITSNTNYEDKQCAIDIRRVLAGLQNFEDWAIEFPDSWGRLPFGLMWGHTISMGQFEECVPIKGFVEKINKTSDLSRAISYKKKDPEYFELGICVPSSCSANMADNLLKTIIKTVFNQDIKDNRTVDEQYCKVDEPIKLRPIDIFAIAFIIFIVFCMLASSIYDYIQTKKGNRKHPLFLAFSVITNAKKVFSVKKVNSPDVIHCLNGIRCFSMMWVVMGHGYMTFYDLPHINKNKFFTWTETPFSMLVQNGTLCVDTFFFMSGLLMLWGAFREMEKTKGKLNIPLMYFHRYIRLTPVVAVVILYIMSLYKYSGAGPMWMKLGTQDKRCEDTWWATLLYVQNYAFPNKICISQSWYLAVDTQLYVFSPIFLIPLWKWGKKSLPPMIVLIVLCVACTFATFMFNDFTLFRVQDEHVDLRQRLTYYPTHTRIPTWLMGVIFGYFLFTKNRGRKIPLAKRWVISGWLLAFGIMLTDLWGPYWRIRPENPDSPIIEGAFYEPLSRAAWALSMAWIVWACYNGHGGLINDFLSWSFFTAFSRLTYCMYVIHRIVQLVNAARLQTDTHFSDYDAVMRWWHDFGLTLCASIFATLAFESPILGIEKAIFGSGSNKRAQTMKKANPIASIDPITNENPQKA